MSRGVIQTPTNTHKGIVSVIPQQFLTSITHSNSNRVLTNGRMAMSPYNKCDSMGQSVYITDVTLRGGPKHHLIVLSHSTKNMTQIKRWFACIWQRTIVVIQNHICYLESGCRCFENVSGEPLRADASSMLDVFLFIFILLRGLGRLAGILSSESE